jgi:hypothetical protein
MTAGWHIITLELAHLKLPANEIRAGGGGAESFAGVLAKCPALTHLDLSYNEIGDAGIESIAGVLPRCAALVFLDLSDNECWGTRYGGVGRLAGVLPQCVNQSLSLLHWALKEARHRHAIFAAVVVIAVFAAHAPKTPANQHSTLQTQHVRANASNFEQQLHALQHQATQLHVLHNQVAVNYSGYTGAGPMTLEQQQSCVAAQAMTSRTDQMAADVTECVAMLLIVPSGDGVGCTIAAMRRHQTNTALVSL